MTAANDELSRSRDLGGLQSLLVLLDDAETAERGFVITGNARYLGPWERASTEIPATIDVLAPALSDDARVQADYAELRAVISHLMALHARTIGFCQNSGYEVHKASAPTFPAPARRFEVEQLPAPSRAEIGVQP